MDSTIQSKNKNFTKNIFMDSFTRLRGALIPYFVLLTAFGPVILLLASIYDTGSNYRILRIAPITLFGMFAVAACFAIWVTLSLTGYIHKKTQADIFFALPVKRASLICTQMAAGAVFVLVPLFLVFTIFELVISLHQNIMHMSFDIHMQIFGVFVFFFLVSYLLMFLSAAIANTALDILIYTAFFQTVIPIVGGLTLFLLRSGIVGFPLFDTWLSMLLYFSPIACFYRYTNYFSLVGYVDGFVFNYIPFICWGIVSFGLVFLIRFIIGKRKAEMAGCKGFIGVFPRVFLCTTIYVGAGVLALLFMSWNDSGRIWQVITFALFGGGVIGFLMYGLLNKGYKNMLKKAGKLYFASVLVSIVMLGVIYFVPLYNHNPPKLDEVESVSISSIGGRNTLYYPNPYGLNQLMYGSQYSVVSLRGVEGIEKVIAGHQEMIDMHIFSHDSLGSRTFEISYHLKNGGIKQVSYNLSSYADQQNQIFYEMRSEEYILNSNAVFAIPSEQVAIHFSKMIHKDSYVEWEESTPLTNEKDKEDLLEALRADILDLEAKNYEERMQYGTSEEWHGYRPEEEYFGSIIISSSYPIEGEFGVHQAFGDHIMIHTEYKRTIAWLLVNGFEEYIAEESTSDYYSYW